MDPGEMRSDIICAVSTPEGRSALAVIRVSGKGSSSVVEGMMGLEEGRLKGRRRKTGFIRRDGEVLDRVVALGWPEGSSYTGEEMVEIICHGVPSISADILECLIDAGARRALPGEFTRRAYVSGRMCAWQVLILASLWSGNGTGNRIRGDAESVCGEFLDGVEKVRELLEADIEFQEEHGHGGNDELSMAMAGLREKASEFRRRASILEGERRVMLMGPVNSGKSTLFNIIAGKETALVSEEPGTTRDGASAHVEIRGRRLMVCDTAGSDGTGMDRMAYERALESLDGNSRVVWMSVGGNDAPPGAIGEKAAGVIRVSSKSDLSNREKAGGWLRLSCITGEGLEELRELISEYPGNMSVTALAERMERRVSMAGDSLQEGDYAVASEYLDEAGNELRDLLDRGSGALISVERALSGMCVGK